jgi:hypothetical protein
MKKTASILTSRDESMGKLATEMSFYEVQCARDMLGDIRDLNVDRKAWRELMKDPKQWSKEREALRHSIVITQFEKQRQERRCKKLPKVNVKMCQKSIRGLRLGEKNFARLSVYKVMDKVCSLYPKDSASCKSLCSVFS